ncbi:MAG: precorrin-6A reductase [Butyrivibrio sp.]|nr:precorrin-6A reductase [Butyrivibrio sp.]
MKDKVLIFGGTTEGRELALRLDKAGMLHAVSVATDYGKEIEESYGESNIIVGRKDADEMVRLMEDGGYSVCVDATHPFATVVSEEIVKACDKCGITYLRLLRKTSAENESAAVVKDNVADACAELENIKGNILLLTGSKDLKEITSRIGDISRVYARVLPNKESISKCEEAGLLGRQIIAMQGPFSKDMNVALIKEISADAILTKESGSTGGLDEKLLAARECGIKAVMIKSPGSSEGSRQTGYSLEEILSELGVDADKRIVLAGIGPGDSRYYTKELCDELENADVIFGAGSVLERLEKSGHKAEFVSMYRGEDILDYLKGSSFGSPLILFSGDISLCSGAKNAAKVFADAGYEVCKISGISSVALFANRLGIGLEDCNVISAHGRECNVTGYAGREKELIVLPSSCSHAGSIVRSVINATNGEVRIVIGYELGTDNEKVFNADTDKLGNTIFSEEEKGKCLMYIDNGNAGNAPVIKAISDDMFIRGNTPMTKEEIRAISVRKLGLCENSVLYDIGAGTGSVSVEAALLHPGIKVYSIEKNDEAAELLEKNKDKFHAENVSIVKGAAPEALNDLPTPTHAFIGGSGGNLKEILSLLKKKNKDVRIVINCVTLETFTQVLEVARTGDFAEPDIIQVSACRYRKAGNYHIADAINPVYIVTFG